MSRAGKPTRCAGSGRPAGALRSRVPRRRKWDGLILHTEKRHIRPSERRIVPKFSYRLSFSLRPEFSRALSMGTLRSAQAGAKVFTVDADSSVTPRIPGSVTLGQTEPAASMASASARQRNPRHAKGERYTGKALFPVISSVGLNVLNV